MREVRRGEDYLHPSDAVRDLVGDGASQAPGVSDGGAGIARHLRRRDDEVDVVRVVAVAVDVQHLHALERALVHAHRLHVGVARVRVATDAVVGVAGHVHQVPRARCERRELVGIDLRAFRVLRGLGQVDVEVDRADVVGIGVEHALRGAHGLADPSLGRDPVGLPVVPRRGIHQRVDVEHRDLEVVRKSSHGVLERGGVGIVQLCAVGLGVGRVAQRERVDEGALVGPVGSLAGAVEGA